MQDRGPGACPTTCMCAFQVPDHTMAILLGLGFCVVAPLIAPIALLYFLVCTLIGKYQMVYVFTPSFQSGGRVSLTLLSSNSTHVCTAAGHCL